MSRLATASAIVIRPIRRPFSNFRFADENFEGSVPIRRLFSQARQRECKTLVVEDVPAEGPVADENSEILGYFPDYTMKGLKRLSFWTTGFSSTADIANQDTESCFGYALLKYDLCPSKGVDSWHVFESALRKYDHTHNYCPCAKMIPFRVGARDFAVPAVLYCQQNGLNKVCAQVALRSICATYLGDFDLTFRRINELAFGGAGPPGAVVRTKQIPLVLAGLGIPFFEFAYTANDPKFRDSLPYQRLLYTGIEAGTGSLVGFKRSGPKADNVGHIIPCFGHTFNEDTWE